MLHSIPIPRYTLADYNQWEGKWELIDGYPYAMSPSPRIKHQLAGRRMIQIMSEQLYRDNKRVCNCDVLYETDWIISDDTVVRPDIAVVCGPINADGFITTTPALVVEILSHSTRLVDGNTKFQLYQQCGVKYYLMADPDTKKLEAFQLMNNQYIEMSEEFSFELSAQCSINLSLQSVFEQ